MPNAVEEVHVPLSPAVQMSQPTSHTTLSPIKEINTEHNVPVSKPDAPNFDPEEFSRKLDLKLEKAFSMFENVVKESMTVSTDLKKQLDTKQQNDKDDIASRIAMLEKSIEALRDSARVTSAEQENSITTVAVAGNQPSNEEEERAVISQTTLKDDFPTPMSSPDKDITPSFHQYLYKLL
ncbi:hypothetical protein DICA3_E01486 [Diutina catenulata]